MNPNLIQHSAAGFSKTHFMFLTCFISPQLIPSDFSLHRSFAMQYLFLIKLTNHISIVGANSRILPKRTTPCGIPHLNGLENIVNTSSQLQRSFGILFLVFFELMAL